MATFTRTSAVASGSALVYCVILTFVVASLSAKGFAVALDKQHTEVLHDAVRELVNTHQDELSPKQRKELRKWKRAYKKRIEKKGFTRKCDPSSVTLSDYPQWRDETGYWIGDYTFIGEDGNHFESARWNYRYGDYRGFITGSVKGNAYRQRNVFMYPPQTKDKCVQDDSGSKVLVVGDGKCGVNGNTKVFFADQNATTCLTNPEVAGDIEGPYLGIFYTKTELVGQDNALLYQVYLDAEASNFGLTQDVLFQSQLTTITQLPDGTVLRTRSAQGFTGFGNATGTPNSLSFFRERKVTKAQFYQEMRDTVEEFRIRSADLCAWMDSTTGGVTPSPYVDNPGSRTCKRHLEESFEL